MPAGVILYSRHLPNPALPQPGAVEVYECTGRPTEYHLLYNIDIDSESDIQLLAEPLIDADADLSVMVDVKGTPECLVRGPVLRHTIKLVHGGEKSSLTVFGSDKKALMDRESKVAVTPAGTASNAVALILGSYGLIPATDSTNGQFSPDKHALVQRETDYEFAMRMARENGLLFWIETDVAGIETANFKKPPLDGVAEVTLTINRPEANISSLEIEWDVQAAASTKVLQADLTTGDLVDGSLTQSSLTLLGGTALGSIQQTASLRHLAAPSDDQGAAQGLSEGMLLESSFFIRAKAVASLSRVGALVRSHTLVDVAGAGTRHSGTWFCSGVRHRINDTEHVMEIELIRNGWSV
jgi:hypothetical protein